MTKAEITVRFRPGWLVCVVLKLGTAQLRCYIGEVQAVGKEGIRITLVDWLVGVPASWDMYIPFRNLESAFIATHEHDQEFFLKEAGKTQTKINHPERTPETTVTQ